MPKKLRPLLAVTVAILAVSLLVVKLSHSHSAVLSPAGIIASRQRGLLVLTTLIMLLIVLPVFGLTFFIAWKYRAGNHEADYQPEWDHSVRLESLWWGLPTAIILVLSVVAWTSSHSLDPSRSLASNQPPLTIQVVALQWKWLFIYPEQQIASVNYVQFPAGRPVNFQITSDAPMNSFWIPRLGGQIYAMAGMSTQLHLMADKPGAFHGSSANLSGAGFAAMQFTAEASPAADFASWVQNTKTSNSRLSTAAYTALSRPGIPKTAARFASFEPGLYDSVLMKYMASGQAMQSSMAGTAHE